MPRNTQRAPPSDDRVPSRRDVTRRGSPTRTTQQALAPPRMTLYGLPRDSVLVHSLSRTGSPAGNGNVASSSTASSLAPQLASAEAHLGRMTLTAPDNMLRRQVQEKEREKNARKAAAAAARRALRGTGSAVGCPIVGIASDQRPFSAASSASTCHLPRAPTRRSSASNLSRSVSPVRRTCPAEVIQRSNLHTSSSIETSSLDGRPSRKHRRPRPTRTSNKPATTALQDALLGRNLRTRAEIAPRASLRRQNTYQELAGMSLPDVESAPDLSEDEQSNVASAPQISASHTLPPPPFPEGSTRPESPPRPPPTNASAWASEDEEIWVSYRRRIPDSPPPAFRSDDEDEHVVEVAQVDSTKNLSNSSLDDRDAISRPSSSASGSGDEPSDSERRAWDEDARRGLSFEERLRRLELRRKRQERTTTSRCSEDRRNEVALQEPLERKGNDSRIAEAALDAQRTPNLPNHNAESIFRVFTEGALSHPSLPTSGHQYSVLDHDFKISTSRPSTRHSSRTQFTAVRPRPSLESESRFRNDATAAAERRRFAWGAVGPVVGLDVPPAPAAIPLPRVYSSSEELPVHRSDVRNDQKNGASEASALSDNSDDSTEAWAAEAAAFEAMRKASQQMLAVSESDKEKPVPTIPTALQSPSAMLSKTLPKAPPPLVLGRSRSQGAAYDTSNSDSPLDHSPYESDYSLNATEEGVIRHINPRWTSNTGANLAESPHLNGNAPKPQPQSIGAVSDPKGKKPIRNDWLYATAQQHHSSSAPEVSKSATAVSGAGDFEFDGGSGVTFSANENEGRGDRSGRRPSLSSIRSANSSRWNERLPGSPSGSHRPEVTERLKGLFNGISMPGPYLAPNSLRRVSSGKSLGEEVAKERMMTDPPKPSMRNSNSAPPLRPSGESARSVRSDRDEQQVRRDTLQNIALLQRKHSANGNPIAQNSLAQLERILAASLRRSSGEMSVDPGSELSGQGAISSRRPQPPTPTAFANKRLSFAPLPRQARLPIITDDTRHFPPSRTPTVVSYEGGRPQSGVRVSALRSLFESGERVTPAAPPTVSPRLRSSQSTPRSQAAAVPVAPSVDEPLRLRRPPPPLPASPSSQAYSSTPSEATGTQLRSLPPRPASPPVSDLLGMGDLSKDFAISHVPPSPSVSTPILGRQPPLHTPPDPSVGVAANQQTSRMSTLTPAPVEVETPVRSREREASVGVTDLDVLASRLEFDGAHFDEIAAIQEFLGPAGNSTLTAMELDSLPCGPVEIEKRRVTRDGKVKTKLACLGLRVDRCGICLSQFKEGQMSLVLGCLHVFHEACARPWFRRRSRACPTCRTEAVGAAAEAAMSLSTVAL